MEYKKNILYPKTIICNKLVLPSLETIVVQETLTSKSMVFFLGFSF